MTVGDQLSHGGRYQADAELVVLDLPGHADAHSLVLALSAQRPPLFADHFNLAGAGSELIRINPDLRRPHIVLWLVIA
jgi:hypothetical protein